MCDDHDKKRAAQEQRKKDFLSPPKKPTRNKDGTAPVYRDEAGNILPGQAPFRNKHGVWIGSNDPKATPYGKDADTAAAKRRRARER